MKKITYITDEKVTPEYVAKVEKITGRKLSGDEKIVNLNDLREGESPSTGGLVVAIGHAVADFFLLSWNPLVKWNINGVSFLLVPSLQNHWHKIGQNKNNAIQAIREFIK